LCGNAPLTGGISEGQVGWWISMNGSPEGGKH